MHDASTTGTRKETFAEFMKAVGRTHHTRSPSFTDNTTFINIRGNQAGRSTTVGDWAAGDTFTLYLPNPIPSGWASTATVSFNPGTAIAGAFFVTSPIDGTGITVADLLPGQLITLQFDGVDGWILLAQGLGSGGSIDSVIAGTSLEGGGSSGNVTLGVSDGGIGSAQIALSGVGRTNLAPPLRTQQGFAPGSSTTYTTGELHLGLSSSYGSVHETDTYLFQAPFGIGANPTQLVSLRLHNNLPLAPVRHLDGTQATESDFTQNHVYEVQYILSSWYIVSGQGAGAGGITSVTTAAASGLAGGSTTGDANLSIAAGGVTEARLNIAVDPNDGEFLRYQSSAMVWGSIAAADIPEAYLNVQGGILKPNRKRKDGFTRLGPGNLS